MINAMTGPHQTIHLFAILFASELSILLVMGFALIGAGLSRTKNTTDILAKHLGLLATACFVFLIFGWHILRSKPINTYIPSFHLQLGLSSHEAVVFLMEFMAMAIILSIVACITVERMRIWGLMFFAFVLVAFILPVEAFWVWKQGFLHALGFVDVSGAAVIHLAGAAAGLAALLLLGPRKHRYEKSGATQAVFPGSNLSLAFIGIFLTWFGFLGLNFGGAMIWDNQYQIFTLAAVTVNTCIAASVSVLVAMILVRLVYGKLDFTIMINAAMMGMVAISASPALPHIHTVVFIGFVAGLLVVPSITLFNRLRLDDPVGMLTTQGVGAIWGLLALACTREFALVAKAKDLDWSWYHQLGIQALGIAVIFLWVFVTSFVVLYLIKVLLGLRVDPKFENKGLDAIDYGMQAYPEFNISGRNINRP